MEKLCDKKNTPAKVWGRARFLAAAAFVGVCIYLEKTDPSLGSLNAERIYEQLSVDYETRLLEIVGELRESVLETQP